MIASTNANRFALAAACVFAAAGAAVGQPTTKPMAATTEPGKAVTVDLSSPKAAVKTLASAQVAGDEKAMRAALIATGETEEKMSSAMVELAVALADFDKAMVARYGPAETVKIMGDPGENLKEILDVIDRATEKVDGEQATLMSNPSAQGTMALKRVNGQWRVVVADLAKAGSPDDVRRTLESETKGAATFRDLTADVTSGKLPTADAAGQAMKMRMTAMNAGQQPPAAGGPPAAVPGTPGTPGAVPPPTTAPAK